MPAVRWFQSWRGILLSTGIFSFLLGVAAATGGQNTALSLASIGLLTVGAVTTTWGLILTLRRRIAPAESPKQGGDDPRP